MRRFLLGLMASMAATAAAAQGKPCSFAFAAQAGSGIYGIEGRVVQIYRVPIAFTARPLDQDRIWGVSVTLPITFGFYDYEPADVISGQFPSHVGTASLLPGVVFDVRALTNWIVSPRVDFGAAKDFDGDSFVWVYDVGIKSVVSFPAGSWDGRAGQELLWAGAAQTDTPLSAWYGRAEAGFEFRHALPWVSRGSQWDIGVFALYDRYFTDKDSTESATAVAYAAPAPTGTKEVDEQTEIGLSFGTRPKLAWWKLSMPKLGVSYRFGDGVHGVRLVFGEIF